MYVNQMKIKNYRLLKDVTIDFDRSLTLFVGKNNTGKTSIMNIMEFLLSDKKTLPFEDYPLDCRRPFYEAVKAYWCNEDENRIKTFQNAVPKVSVELTIDYSDDDDYLGALGNFIIDLDESINAVIITVSFDIPLTAEETLAQCKAAYDALVSSPEHPDEDSCIASVLQEAFPRLFEMNIYTVNPGNLDDKMIRSKTDLKGLFCMHTIKAERSLDESDSATDNPIGQIMKKLFNTEIMQDELDAVIEEIPNILIAKNKSLRDALPDVDYAIWDQESNFILICELKWLVEADSTPEVFARIHDLEHGCSQVFDLLNFAKTNCSDFCSKVFGIVNYNEMPNVVGCVISKRGIRVDNASIPVISLQMFLNLLKNKSAVEAINDIAEKKYLLSSPKNFEFGLKTVSYAGYTFEIPALIKDQPVIHETYKRIGRKIGRNDPCPCGSGKKYKKCCGR